MPTCIPLLLSVALSHGGVAGSSTDAQHTAPAASPPASATELRCASRDGKSLHAIAIDGSATPCEVGGGDSPPRATVRSDGAVSAKVVVEGRGVDSMALIELARPAGARPATGEGAGEEARAGLPTRIDPRVSNPRHLGWTGAGELLFEGAADGHRGIYAIAVDDPARPIRRLSPDDRDCVLPTPSPTGAVAWAMATGREGKMALHEIVLSDAGSTRTLLKDVPTTALAFSPDGTRLAVGRLGAIQEIDVATGTQLRRWECSALDQRLYAHLPEQIVWSPDGSMLAFTCPFAGGRVVSSEGVRPVLFGDREVFILLPDADPSARLIVATLPGDAGDLEWRSVR